MQKRKLILPFAFIAFTLAILASFLAMSLPDIIFAKNMKKIEEFVTVSQDQTGEAFNRLVGNHLLWKMKVTLFNITNDIDPQLDMQLLGPFEANFQTASKVLLKNLLLERVVTETILRNLTFDDQQTANKTLKYFNFNNNTQVTVKVKDFLENTLTEKLFPVIRQTKSTGHTFGNLAGKILEVEHAKKTFLYKSILKIPATSGTDGTQFGFKMRNHITDETMKDKVLIYDPRLERFLQMDFRETIKIQGIETREYRLSKSTFMPVSAYERNADFITSPYPIDPAAIKTQTLVRISGLPCTMTFCYSKPFFVDTLMTTSEIKFAKNEDGDPNLHDTYIRVEPISGMTIEAVKRFQISSVNFNDSKLFPVVWFEESFTIAAAEKVKLKSLLNGLKVRGIRFTAWLICIALLVISLILLCADRRLKAKEVSISTKCWDEVKTTK